MRVLFVSHELVAANLAYLLKMEGCDVKLYIENIKLRGSFRNLVKQTTNWRKELKWVKQDGLIVFDDIGYGDIQDKLRKEGYSVFGGSKLGDRLEENRQWSQKILKKFRLRTLPTYNFDNVNKAILFAKHNNNGPWVVKQNGSAAKDINYVGQFKDNRDVISVLKNYLTNYGNNLGKITLQQKALGIEIGVGRYFNGDDWAGPIEINVEHKKMFPGNLGPTTSEMGTLAWYDDNEENRLFKETLAKLKPFLQEIDYRGDIDVNCIVNEKGAFALEMTPRLGSPIIHLHSEIHSSPWHKFLKAVADKKCFRLKWKKGFGIVILVAVPPFPYSPRMKGISSLGLEVFFHSSIINSNYRHVHFEGISIEKLRTGSRRHYVSDHPGYILYVTALGKSINEAREKADVILRKIHIPKMFYRNDIGLNFQEEGINMLNKWGYL
ncbi:MAG: hypothetical protein PHZ00_05720 [Candidatus Peribacteraceae bacterium]|nr:hypothetical protein [Candidatus Peribacteraceae bacterium]